nr:hypothetical protein [Tanacetum cinerariifolium]
MMNRNKRQKTSEYEAYVSGESSSGQNNEQEQDDDEIPTKQVSQDIMEEVSLNVDEAKLKKIVDEMLRQRCTSGDERQYHIDQMKNFLKKHWKNPHAKIFYIRKQKEPRKPKEERVHDFQLGIKSYQQKVNLTAPIISFPGIKEFKMFSIIYEPMHGIIYKNNKKEKRVMRYSEIHKADEKVGVVCEWKTTWTKKRTPRIIDP